jgi:hypothetical protein
MTLVSLPLRAQSPLSSSNVRGSDLPAGITGMIETATAANLERFRVEKSRKAGFEAPVTR